MMVFNCILPAERMVDSGTAGDGFFAKRR